MITILFLVGIVAMVLICLSIRAMIQRRFGAACINAAFALALVLAMSFCVRSAKAVNVNLGGGTSYFLMQSGTNITSLGTSPGTVTNTFATSFSTNASAVSNIQVFCTQMGTTNSPSNLVQSITATNFIYNAGTANVQFNWLAIGPPQ